ncbi:MAG: CoA pyrophosphatase [Prolixibacteraceae bacterium]|nr:CoA pyrophosphatase [Prolixibacteraceae bacterium]
MHSPILKYLEEAFHGELPGIEAHRKMLPPGRSLASSEDEMRLIKQSSILLLLFPEGEQIYTCLTRRPATMTFHPGQVSFPGGKVEKEDISAEMTALREAREEIGIDTSGIRILGKLSDLYLEVSGFSIQPFLAWADKKPDFVVNPGEVEELILFPISDFVKDETTSETVLDTFTGPLQIKYYPFNGEIIWGATAMILSELIEILKKHGSDQSQSQ